MSDSKKKHSLNTFDKRLLQKVRDNGFVFDDGRSLRGMNLERAGLLTSSLRLRTMRSNGEAEYRQAFKITDAGRKALEEAKS